MGSFLGHLLPAVFFFLYGSWWTIRITQIRTHLINNRKRSRSSTVLVKGVRIHFPIPGCAKLPLEPIIIVCLCLIGMLSEIIAASMSTEHQPGDMQHMTIYMFFVTYGIIDVMTHYRIIVPLGADYFSGALAFFGEALLFTFHIEHQQIFEKRCHILLLVSILGCCFSTILEAFNPTNLDLKYARTFFCILQGTWFLQVAFFIFNPLPGTNHPWHSATPMHDSLYASIMFGWHIAGVFFYMIIIGAFVTRASQQGFELPMNVHTPNGIGNGLGKDVPQNNNDIEHQLLIEDDSV